ncbi:universal stress protein [Ramlibacter tataouinensis]|uniref:Bifunctional protein: transcriptional regulator, AraC family universal stress protein-like protein n=1 Tax=Ramlibacter tataouinensis (strain ATCC BAA-407 / DSM 14655 / LMG 21543 / TTB310) TaxID=365046 RepID=F5XWU7_RAMTT|nr:universal stress protein [Ramlibacter tataouinensis]AEG91708.1 bifunctional protein : transcriptional regulator, AraC family; universal stress protein-like protein [Ramlibacter tataouinensis TTB310]
MTPLQVRKYPNARVTASSGQRDWPGLLAELLEHPAGRIASFAATMTELTVVLQGSASVRRQLDGARPQRIDAAPGAMWLTPAGVREDFVEFESAVAQVLHIYLTRDRFRCVCPRSWPCSMAIATLRRDAPFGDPLLEEIARVISAELQAQSGEARLLTEPLSLCLAARLLHDHTDAQPDGMSIQQASGLEARRLARVREHVAAHLDHDLSVAELAKVACLSPSRFAHGFKTSTGESPQQYVSAQRLERARTLLCNSRLPLAEIARVCGFSSQASFTKAFVRATSQPPGRYRADHRDRCLAGSPGARSAGSSNVQLSWSTASAAGASATRVRGTSAGERSQTLKPEHGQLITRHRFTWRTAMDPIRTVLAATDFSLGARWATSRAAQLAAAHQAALNLVHVVEPDGFLAVRDFVAGSDLQARVEEQGRMELAALAETVTRHHSLPVHTLLRTGRPLEELSAAASSADVVVLGAQGSHPVRQFALGSTADRLSRLTHRPLLVVRSEPDGGYCRVLVAVDFSEASRQALQAALRLAPDATLHLVHCFDVPFEGWLRMAGTADQQIEACRARSRARAMEQCQALLAQLGGGTRASASVRQGDARLELLAAADEEKADLIAVGKQGQALVADTLLGSVTSWVLREASCDVLMVPSKAPASA